MVHNGYDLVFSLHVCPLACLAAFCPHTLHFLSFPFLFSCLLCVYTCLPLASLVSIRLPRLSVVSTCVLLVPLPSSSIPTLLPAFPFVYLVHFSLHFSLYDIHSSPKCLLECFLPSVAAFSPIYGASLSPLIAFLLLDSSFPL